jgi:hypothetical protein
MERCGRWRRHNRRGNEKFMLGLIAAGLRAQNTAHLHFE